MKIKTYSVDEIFEKKLYFLIPFHIFAYESDFKKYDASEEKMRSLRQVYEKIVVRLNECVEKKELTEYQKRTIVDMSKKVLEHIAVKYAKVKEGIGEIMGGKILDYEAKDILNAGKAEGCVETIIETLV